MTLSKEFFHLESDIFICFSYITPCTFLQQSNEDTLDAIIRDINTYKDKGRILLCGDLNARTGQELDFIQKDDDRHLPLDTSYIIDTNISQRKSEDTKIDERGKQLLDLCISGRLRILNGRSTGDSYGKFTCQKPTGASVVDYVILSEELIKEIIYFHVHPFKPMFSDCHSKISFNLKASYINRTPKNLTKDMPIPFQWRKCSPELFQKALECPSITSKIKSFLHINFNSDVEQVNKAANLFEEIIVSTAQLCLRRTRTSKSKTNTRKKWFDEDLYVKRRDLTSIARNMFNQPFNLLLRNTYFKHYREYRKLVKFKKKNFKNKIVKQLDALENKDPKQYWNLVNSLKEECCKNNGPELSIDSESWLGYFQNLNVVQDKFKARINALEKILKEDRNSTFSFLDSIIKHSEISTSISKLKNCKSSGLDNIKNEMLKSGLFALLPCLHKLFNLVFSSGIYPSSWATGFITPIFKTGDTTQPENYRGITINSNVGKLFNMILNARLDKYLEENNIIDESQIGFKKHARTSDHMFVLKSLIDKYINKPGGR
ncbi:MAG: hypothetical protein AB2693_27665, partial [Candidatus Thiodiazotropha sp.]